MNNADPESQSLMPSIISRVDVYQCLLAAAEIAVVSVNKNRVEQKRKTATQSSKLLKVLQDPNNFLSTIK